MYKHFAFKETLWLLVLSSSLLAIPGCSPKVKMALWVKKNQDAAIALGIWSVSNTSEATTLLNMDCTDRKQFKKKISDAINGKPTAQAGQQGYDAQSYNYHYGNVHSNRSDVDGFVSWCKQYPKAAKRLRSHAKALCKTGLGLLSGGFKIN